MVNFVYCVGGANFVGLLHKMSQNCEYFGNFPQQWLHDLHVAACHQFHLTHTVHAH